MLAGCVVRYSNVLLSSSTCTSPDLRCIMTPIVGLTASSSFQPTPPTQAGSGTSLLVKGANCTRGATGSGVGVTGEGVGVGARAGITGWFFGEVSGVTGAAGPGLDVDGI